MSSEAVRRYPVSEWLAALEREERRQTVIQWCFCAVIAGCGLAMMVITLLNNPPVSFSTSMRTFNMVCGALCIVFAAMFTPGAVRELLRRTWLAGSVDSYETKVENDNLAERIISGDYTGNEVRQHVPKFLVWLFPKYIKPSLAIIIRRISLFGDIYVDNSSFPILGQLFQRLLAVAIIIITLHGAITMSLPNDGLPQALNLYRFYNGITMFVGYGIPITLFQWMSTGSTGLHSLFPYLRRKWQEIAEAEIADSAAEQQA